MSQNIDTERLRRDFNLSPPENGEGVFDTPEKVDAFHQRIEDNTRALRERDRRAREASHLAAQTQQID